MNLANFDNSDFERGASRAREMLWLLTRRVFFDHSVLPWYRLRRAILSGFGARLGPKMICKPGARITFPWKLQVGANSWLGEQCWLLNLDCIKIGSNVCISQRALLCTGSHDWSSATFDLITAPVVVHDGAWICADTFVAPGVTIGRNAVVTAGSVVTGNLPPDMICSGNPCVPVKERVIT